MEEVNNYSINSSTSQNQRENHKRFDCIEAISSAQSECAESGKGHVVNSRKRKPKISRWMNRIELMCNLHIVMWLVMFAQAIRTAAWMWLYMEIKWAIPHTFAWEALLTPLASIHIQGDCPDYKSFCPETVYPFIPLIAATVSTIQILVVCFIMFLENCANICSVFVTHFITVAEVVFFFLTTPAVSTIVVQYVHHLNNTMRLQMKESNTSTILRWKITQHALKCCGVLGYEDWNKVSPDYPESCCDTNIGFCAEGNVLASYVWEEGCFNYEKSTFHYYGWMEVSFLCLGLFVTLVQHYSILQFKRNIAFNQVQDHNENPGSRNIYIRQGTSFVSVNQEHKTNNIIRVNDITIKTIGPLAAMVGIIDSLVSIQVCNYGPDDKIILSREPAQILITICSAGVARGVVKITAVDCQKLQGVRVASNSSGSITIQTKESMYCNV